MNIKLINICFSKYIKQILLRRLNLKTCIKSTNNNLANRKRLLEIF